MAKCKAPSSKPRRPLSAFNIFVLLEHKSILDNKLLACPTYSIQDVQRLRLEYKFRSKRVHRKSHGKFSFKEFRAFVADRWKKVDNETRMALEDQAVLEKEEYQKKVNAWKNSLADSKSQPSALQTATNSNQLLFETAIRDLNSKIQELETFINHHGFMSNRDLCYDQKSPGPNSLYQALAPRGLEVSVSTSMPCGCHDTDTVLQYDDCSIIPFDCQDNMVPEHAEMACNQSFPSCTSFEESHLQYFMSGEEMENLFNC